MSHSAYHSTELHYGARCAAFRERTAHGRNNDEDRIRNCKFWGTDRHDRRHDREGSKYKIPNGCDDGIQDLPSGRSHLHAGVGNVPDHVAFGES